MKGEKKSQIDYFYFMLNDELTNYLWDFSFFIKINLGNTHV